MAVLLSFFEKRKGPSPPPAPLSPSSAMIKLKPSRCTNIHFYMYELIRVRKLPGVFFSEMGVCVCVCVYELIVGTKY